MPRPAFPSSGEINVSAYPDAGLASEPAGGRFLGAFRQGFARYRDARSEYQFAFLLLAALFAVVLIYDRDGSSAVL